jgi:hypothetical protein
MSKQPDDEDAPALVVETQAFTAMAFYAKNYESLSFRDLDPKAGKETMGDKPPRCRFCGRSKPAVTFSNDAHVVPAFVGNRVLFSRYECDDCNARFSAFEDDLAKMTMGDRAVGQVPKRKGFTSLKPQGKKSSFERGPGGVIIKQYADEGVFALDRLNSQLVATFETQPFRPLGVYKALAKVAFTLLPAEDLPDFEELRLWLLEEDVTTRKVYGEKGHWCFQTFVPGPSPFPRPIVSLMKRKEGVDAPYLMFFLAFGNWTYQIFPPCPRKDSFLADQKINIVPYPHLYTLQPWLAKGRIQATQLYLDEAERRSEPKELRLHYDAIGPGPRPDTFDEQTRRAEGEPP